MNMKTTILNFTAAIIAVIFMSNTLFAQNYVVDTKNSNVYWTGKKVTGQHTGTINISEGEILKTGNALRGNITIDMNSMICTDLEGEYGEKLIGHLASPDFFDVENHSTSSFTILRAVEDANSKMGTSHKLIGMLAIKGKSMNYEIPANIVFEGNTMTASAKFQFDRTDYDIKYGSGKFFEGLGDKMIYDDVDVELNIVANVGEKAPVRMSKNAYKVDLENSNVNWLGKKVTGQHSGNVKLKSGNFDGNTGAFVIDMTTIACTDLEGEMAANLVGHLASPDFFDVKNHSEAEIVINSLTQSNNPGISTHIVKGDLTIKGITKPIEFPANVLEEGQMVTIGAIVKFDRTDYNIKYGSGKFFESLGDKMIYDEVEVEVNIVGQRPAVAPSKPIMKKPVKRKLDKVNSTRTK